MMTYSNLSFKRIVNYHDLYPERRLYKIYRLLDGFNRKQIMKLISNMNIHLVNEPFYNANLQSEEYDAFRFCFSKVNMRYMCEGIQRFQKFAQRGKDFDYSAATKETPLYLLRELMAHYQHPKVCNRKRATNERYAFMAILIANYLTMERDTKVNKSPFYNISQEMNLACLMLSRFSYEDIVQFDSRKKFLLQTLKCFNFFVFAEQDVKFKPLLLLFKNRYGLTSLAQYVTAFWGILLVSGFKEGIIDFSNLQEENQKISEKIIEACSVDYDAIIPKKENIDYAEFRNKPFINLGNQEYFIINIGFVVERIYNSLYFEFRSLWSEYYKKEHSNSYNQYFTTYFSEGYLFVKTLKSVARHTAINSALSDHDCQVINQKESSPPDFYMRKGNIIILFENKDVKISKNIKANGDFMSMISELNKRFVHDGERPKGVGQLIRNIKRIREGKFVWDSNSVKDSTIYPVLVVADEKFTIQGLKNYLQYQQKKEYECQKLNSKNIKPLILVDLATLAMYKENFEREGFINYFEEYYIESTFGQNITSNDIPNKLMSFSDFMYGKECFGLKKLTGDWSKAIKSSINL